MKLSSDLLLHAYRSGVFPMGEPETGEVGWYAPHRRALLPLDERFHVSRNLRKLRRRNPFMVTCDRDFEGVIAACAAPAPDRPSTWITEEIRAGFLELHRVGYAHSIECWRGGDLAGGLYGVAIGGAFFGESMFSSRRDASKVALIELVERLRTGGFELLDIQFMTPHLARFGAFEVSRDEYLLQLDKALSIPAVWPED